MLILRQYARHDADISSIEGTKCTITALSTLNLCKYQVSSLSSKYPEISLKMPKFLLSFSCFQSLCNLGLRSLIVCLGHRVYRGSTSHSLACAPRKSLSLFRRGYLHLLLYFLPLLLYSLYFPRLCFFVRYPILDIRYRY